MDRASFAKGMAFLQAAMQVTAPEATLHAYWHCLKDLDHEVWQTAVVAAAASHEFHTLPSVAALRKAAQRARQGVPLTWEEGFSIACRAIRRAGGEYATAEDRQQVLGQMPGLLGALAGRMWSTICHSDEPTILRAQWHQAWEAAEERGSEIDRLPPSVRPKRVAVDLGKLFRMPKGIE